MLSRIALRIAAVEAIKGKTLVGDNVLDSQIGALDVAGDGTIVTDQKKPFISVYTEGSIEAGRLDFRSVHNVGETELLFEMGMTAAMTDTDPDTGESRLVGIGIPATDPAIELFLEAVGRQVINALADPDNEWAAIWRDLAKSHTKIQRRRASDAGTGTRIAAHQTVITIDLLPEPIYGRPLAGTSVWSRLFAKMDATNHPYLAIMRSLIESETPPTTLDTWRRDFGLSIEHADALGQDSGNVGNWPDGVLTIIDHPGGVIDQPDGGLA